MLASPRIAIVAVALAACSSVSAAQNDAAAPKETAPTGPTVTMAAMALLTLSGP